MKATRTDLLRPGDPKSETERLWIYNGLDCCVTLEVLEAILPARRAAKLDVLRAISTE